MSPSTPTPLRSGRLFASWLTSFASVFPLHAHCSSSLCSLRGKRETYSYEQPSDVCMECQYPGCWRVAFVRFFFIDFREWDYFPNRRKLVLKKIFMLGYLFFIVKIWWLLILMFIFNQTKKINKCFDSLEFEYVYNLDILKYFYFHKNIKKVNFKTS